MQTEVRQNKDMRKSLPRLRLIYPYLQEVSLLSLHYLFETAFLYPPQTVFVGGYTVFTLFVLPCVCACVRNVLFP